MTKSPSDSSLFLSEKFSDINLKLIGSNGEVRIIPAHKAILAQHSEYFETLFDLLSSGKFATEPDQPLSVDISEIGTISDVLDIFRLFYSNLGEIPDLDVRFKNFNDNIIHKFLVKGIILEILNDPFKDITFRCSKVGKNYNFFTTTTEFIGTFNGDDSIEIFYYEAIRTDLVSKSYRLEILFKFLPRKGIIAKHGEKCIKYMDECIKFLNYHNVKNSVEKLEYIRIHLNDPGSRAVFKLISEVIVKNCDEQTKSALEDILAILLE